MLPKGGSEMTAGQVVQTGTGEHGVAGMMPASKKKRLHKEISLQLDSAENRNPIVI